MNNRRVYHARGKLLGGSSSINGMIFIRGNPLDYEKWAKDPGMKSWDYAHCLPYFKKSENRTAGVNSFRGGSGPLHLETGPATNPLFTAFFDSAKQAGYPLNRATDATYPNDLQAALTQIHATDAVAGNAIANAWIPSVFSSRSTA